jgi:hypothetical protein
MSLYRTTTKIVKNQLFYKKVIRKFKINSKLANRMEKVTAIRFTELPKESPYIKPCRMYYTQNGTEKNWDLLKVCLRYPTISCFLQSICYFRCTIVSVLSFLIQHGRKSSLSNSSDQVCESHSKSFSNNPVIDF